MEAWGEMVLYRARANAVIDLDTFKIIFNYFRLIPTVDCFTSGSNFKCIKFFSKIPQMNSVGVNLFMQILTSTEINWACPPLNLVIDLFKHDIVKFKDVAIVVFVPVWKRANYWPYIVKGNFFHPLIERYKLCSRIFELNNSASNLFSGRKKFLCLALLVKSGSENNVPCFL